MEEMIENKQNKKSYHIKNLYLDPNNYRFVDSREYQKIDEKSVLEDRVQKKTRGLIEGKNREGVKDLIESFKANGFLEVDIIQVREISENRFLILEGNRRITALKCLQEDYDKGLDIGELNPNLFKSIPFEIHDNEDIKKHMIIMGLKHISGNKKWTAINQANLIYDYLLEFWGKESYYLEEEKLCKSLGISKVTLRNSQRAYNLILDYEKSDFGDQFKSDMYSLFVEITKRPSLKEWLEWDDESYKSGNYNNLNRLFSWISKNEDTVEEDSEENFFSDAIITKTPEIRELSLFINNKNAIEEMERTKSVTQGLLFSGGIERKEFEKTIFNLKDNIGILQRYSDLISLENKSELEQLKEEFERIFPEKFKLNIMSKSINLIVDENKKEHFTELNIKKYKVFENFSMEKLNRINIFVGLNNTGKTTLLEAIYLLTKQNDTASFVSTIKERAKLEYVTSEWLDKTFEESIEIEGVFNSEKTGVKISKFQAVEIDKKEDYIASYEVKSKFGEQEKVDTIHTFGYETLKRNNIEVVHLCNSTYKSPYFNNPSEMYSAYSYCVENKIGGETILKKIVNFMAKLDTTIVDITLIKVGKVNKFIVESTKLKTKNLDITSYGEGFQRMFEIALVFSKARNGVILIDEFETAIHKELLIKFTDFVHELALMFNVQVFLTSHSKECIDAFVKNESDNSEISAYLLINKEDKIQTKYINGKRLKYLIDNIDLDIRSDA